VNGAVLDTGALVGFERNDRRVVAIVARALVHQDPLVVPAGVLAQAWRDVDRQVRLARLLGSLICEVVPLDDHRARASGQLCGVAGTTDVVGASVALTAKERGLGVITSDPEGLRRLDHRLDLVAV
jgi:hypothetical protein